MAADIKSHPDPLPCRNQLQVIRQIQPTIHLLKHLDTQHPDVLQAHDIDPQDYHSGLVFRSAIESIRGSYIASSTPGREQYIADILSAMRAQGLIYDFDKLSSRERWDFEIFPDEDQTYLAVIALKGGEGNSINISVRSRMVKEFGIWSHLDGSIQHHASHGAQLVIGRIANELSVRQKQVDMLFFKDVLCGTRARPCPKYFGQEAVIGANTAPDIFLFPQRVPTLDDPEPPVHTLDTVRLPKLILDHFGVSKDEHHQHVWEVHIRLIQRDDRPVLTLQRLISVYYQGKEIVKRRGKMFRPTTD